MDNQYSRLRDYAVIGDGRTAALVSKHGSVDRWCLPNLDSPSVFASVLDADRGGRWVLHPDDHTEAVRRYIPDTNVLETIFTTATGRVRVTDVMTLPGERLAPLRELARRVEGLDGQVAMRWRIEPRFGYGLARTRIDARKPFPIATSGNTAIAACAWNAGPIEVSDTGFSGHFAATAGGRATIAIVAAHGEPLVFPARDDVEARIDATAAFWRSWSMRLTYQGPWRDAVVRSALALKLLVFAPSGAIAAAPTTSLPEAIGGERNWDYRFSWIRDSAFAIESLLQLHCDTEAKSFFWWFMHATQRTLPRLNVLYRLDGDTRAPERTLPLAGYRDSRPVRVGNGAANQLQLDTYGELVDAAYQYVQRGYQLGRDTGRDIARVADFVCSHWRDPDSGIWEVRAGPRHHTQSKAMCWVALDRARRLAEAGQVPARRAPRWASEAESIRRFIALFAGTTLVNVLLPAVHPRMGTPSSAADSSPLLEPPGFMLLNYGRTTPVLTILAHLVYGAIVGASSMSRRADGPLKSETSRTIAGLPAVGSDVITSAAGDSNAHLRLAPADGSARSRAALNAITRIACTSDRRYSRRYLPDD